MANTLNGVNLAQVAQKSLDALLVKLIPLMAFTTDFSDAVAAEGSSVVTRVPTATTSGSLSTGYATNAQNVTTSGRTITLGDVQGQVVGFTDSEWSLSSVNLQDIFVKPGINAIANDMMADAFALVLNANFSQETIIAAAAFNADKLADIGTTASLANVPDDRFCIVNPTYYGALSKDPAIAAAYAFGGNQVVTTGRIPTVRGFAVHEYNAVPTNSENLVGIAGAKQGILIAARVPAAPQGFAGEIANVTDPDSGFTLQLRKWYSADDGKYYMSMGAMWGVLTGVAANVICIRSAAR